jgi:hypothetical protein
VFDKWEFCQFENSADFHDSIYTFFLIIKQRKGLKIESILIEGVISINPLFSLDLHLSPLIPLIQESLNPQSSGLQGDRKLTTYFFSHIINTISLTIVRQQASIVGSCRIYWLCQKLTVLNVAYRI